MSQTKRIAGYSRGLPLFFAMIIATSLIASCGDSVTPWLDRADCPETINTPKQYAAAVKEFRAPPEFCISPELFTTSLQGGSRLYPEDFDYAWANSSTNAHRYLELNKRWGQSGDGPTLIKMLTAIQSFIGFGITAPSSPDDWHPGSQSMQIAVYTLPKKIKAQVPAFENWARIAEIDYDIVVPAELGEMMIEPYTTMRPGQSVVDVFTDLTGCDGEGTYPYRSWPIVYDMQVRDGVLFTIPSNTCDPEVRAAMLAGSTCKVGSSNGTVDCETTSEECFIGFRDRYYSQRIGNLRPQDTLEDLLGPLRAAISYCQDANPFNTGVGLGFNTAANPFSRKPWAEQTVSDRYTGREFIVPNLRLKDLPSHKIVTFPPLDKEACKAIEGATSDTHDSYGREECNFEASGEGTYDFLTEGYGFYERE
ncbi:MAG: hypothetical protein P8R45_09690 [Candidatus Binatia bacterium]|nr:hypothetical protein [Candidatus Binatia bacterium]